MTTHDTVPIRVELAFGFTPATTPGASDWVDVTDDLDLTASYGGVIATTGRRAVRQGITPGELSFSLENLDGKYDPRNADGPYYGDLLNGVPVRVVTDVDGSPYTVFRGFINSGWPQQITSRFPVVNITAHDIIGLMAQGEAPSSAWDVAVNDLANQPDQHWTVGVDGWIDRKTGNSARHTGGLTETPAVVDGGGTTWGQFDPDGFAAIEDPTGTPVPGTDKWIIHARFRADPDATEFRFPPVFTDPNRWEAFPVYAADAILTDGSAFPQLQIMVTPAGVLVHARRDNGKTARFWTNPDMEETRSGGLWDGKTHSIMVAGDGVTVFTEYPQKPRIWIDGVQLLGSPSPTLPDGAQSWDTPISEVSGPAIGGSRRGFSYFAAQGGALIRGDVPYVGTVDHVMVWVHEPLGVSVLGEMAADLHEAATIAWVGDRLDERITNIVTGMGLSGYLGTLDTSGIVTQQGYRQAKPLDLLQRIEDTEQGRIWVDNLGKIRFTKRDWSSADTVSTVTQITFSDDPALIDAGTAVSPLEDGTVITDDPLNIVNVAAVNSTFGRQQTVENATSVAKYGRRNAVQLSNLLHPSDRQSRSLAEWLVLSQGEPQLQVETVSFRVEDDEDTLLDYALGVREGWRIRTLIGDTDILSHVIGMSHRWDFTGWTVSLNTDATRTGFTPFTWGTSEWGDTDHWSF